MFLLKAFFLLIMGISCIHCQETISCGETKEGDRSSQEEVKFTFKALNDYSQVYLEGCESTHDIWLQIFDSTGRSIADEDDQFEHGVTQTECGNKYAGDITIPGDVKRDEQYTFVVKGYKLRYGHYSVKLICVGESPYEPDETSSTSSTPSPTQEENDDNEECKRIRRPWHNITQSERNLYINGFRELKRSGKLDEFTRSHHDRSLNQHGNAGFLPWHRYFIWELETQIRNLGEDYECFGLPYWDWSYDIQNATFNIADWNILNSGLGGPGNKDNNYCVDNDGWDDYRTLYPSNGDYCLRRKICGENGESCSFTAQASKLHSLLTDEYSYGDDDDEDYRYGEDYRYRLEGYHGTAHIRIGGSYESSRGHLGDISKANEDPIFYLIHSFVDFHYALWQDCRDHEQISGDRITSSMYNGSTYRLDDYLDYGILSDQQWFSSAHGVTVRDMHSIEDWDVIYDKGDYFDRAKVEDDASICQGTINQNWFKDISGRRRLKSNNKQKKYASDNEEYSQDVFDKISTKYGCHKSSTPEKKAELYKTWAQLDCQFLTVGNNCVRPKYFDDGSDIEADRYVEGTGQFDIDITLDELIEKVKDYPCMVETRQQNYEWAKQVGNLKGLARGDYDTFCDHGFVSKQGAEEKCAANQDKKKKKRGKDKGKDTGKGDYNVW